VSLMAAAAQPGLFDQAINGPTRPEALAALLATGARPLSRWDGPHRGQGQSPIEALAAGRLEAVGTALGGVDD
jgi:hypothetical protein